MDTPYLEQQKAEAWEAYYAAKLKADDLYKKWADLRRKLEQRAEAEAKAEKPAWSDDHIDHAERP